MSDGEIERFEFESSNAVALAKATLTEVDMEGVRRIAVEIERDTEEPEPEPEPEPVPEAAEADGGDTVADETDDETNGSDTDSDRHKTPMEAIESSLPRVYPIVEYLDEHGPAVTARIESDLEYRAGSIMAYLHDADLVERDSVGGEQRWMYIYRLTDKGRRWLAVTAEPADAYPQPNAAPPRDVNIEVYEEMITGDEFGDDDE